jgi:hypothetical protein
MANIKITELPAASSTTGSDVFPIVQSDTTKKAALSLLPVSTATQNALDAKVDDSQLGQPSGVATLDSGGKLTSAQIPDIAVSDYLGAVADQAAMLALTGQRGDWCTRTDLGTNWIITGSDPTQIGSWTQLSYPTAPVISVNGEVGAVVLDASDVGATPLYNGDPVNPSAIADVAYGLRSSNDAVILQGTSPTDVLIDPNFVDSFRSELGIVAPPPASNDTPEPLGTPNAGTGTAYSRGDHIHAMPSAYDIGAMPINPNSIDLYDGNDVVQGQLGTDFYNQGEDTAHFKHPNSTQPNITVFADGTSFSGVLTWNGSAFGTAATANLNALPETLRIVGGTDATKKLAFELDTLVSTATTRTLTVPNSSGTIALLQTLPVELVIACSDETSNLTVGANKVTFRAPSAFTLTAVRACVNTAPAGSTLVVDINKSGTSVLSTKLSIDANETTSLTAAIPAVISDSAIANDAAITIDIDQIGSTIAGKGLKVVLIGTRT